MLLIWLEVHQTLFSQQKAHIALALRQKKPKNILFTTLEIVSNLIVTFWPQTSCLTSRLKTEKNANFGTQQVTQGKQANKQ